MIWIFVAALVVHLFYWLAVGLGVGRAMESSPDEEPTEQPAISVIIAARDEAEILPDLLEALARQTYQHYEVLVVDDGSTDSTPAVVESAARADSRVRLLSQYDAEPPRKKRALILGITEAKHERLAFTDADCVPDARWLETIARHSHRYPECVLVGFGPLEREPGPVNTYARYETFLTALLTAAAIGFKRPFMAVGRNLSYPKSLFDRLGGFEHQMHSLSGDDDLLVQEAHRHGARVRYMLEAESAVWSRAPSNLRSWFRQKLRHTSAGRYYDPVAKAHLAAFHASNLLVWVSPLFLGWTGAALLAVRFLVQRALLRRSAPTFAVESDVLIAQPVLDLGYLVHNTLVAPLGVLFGGKRW